MKNFLILLLSVLLFSCNSKKGNGQESTSLNDSINYYLLKSEDLKLSIENRLIMINKAIKISNKSTRHPINDQIAYQKNRLLFSSGQYDSLKIAHKKLINGSLKNKSNSYAAKSYYLMGYYYSVVVKKPDSAFINYNLSRNYYQSIGDSSWVGKNLINMATIQKDQNDFFGSKETLTTAIPYLLASKDSTEIAGAYNIIGTDHRRLLNMEEAVNYYQRSLKTTTNEEYKLIYKNNLAATYIDQQDYNKAILLLTNLSKFSLVSGDNKEYARILDNLAYAQWLSGVKVDKQGFIAPLEIRKQNNDKRGQIASYTHLGEFYSKTNTTKAIAYFDSVIQVSKILKIPRAEKDALKFLMELEPKNINIRNRYVVLQDSIYEEELKVSTRFAKYKYDDKVKQEENVRLEKENAEKELEASQQRNQKILFLGGLLFISSILGLSLYGFRQRTKRLKQKNRSEKITAIQETEAELSRKLHDDHGGKLNKVMSLVQRDAEKGQILDIVEGIYNQTRDFSRELNSVDTGPDFWKIFKETLEYAKPIEVELILDGGKELEWQLIGHQTKTVIFKVLQELVINMARHSKANQAVILFKDLNKELSIYYEDDGVGASKEALLRKNGLQNTEKRIQAIGGSIIFDSEEGKGFRAEIRTPK